MNRPNAIACAITAALAFFAFDPARVFPHDLETAAGLALPFAVGWAIFTLIPKRNSHDRES